MKKGRARGTNKPSGAASRGSLASAVDRPQHGDSASFGQLIGTLRRLYEGQSQDAVRFRYGLLAFDLITVAFIVLSSFVPRTSAIEILDIVFGLIIFGDFISRLLISRNRVRDILHPVSWADAVAIVSFLIPYSGQAAAFLRILRTLRLLHTYQLLARLRRDSPLFRHYEEVILALAHLGIFLFIMTGIVYETQHWKNPEIGNYIDALYFTVSSLTTTGYGDIVLSGTLGRFLSVVIMIFGVTLFFQLARAILQPYKVRFPCHVCGLQRHDIDAVHCKACGTLLNIPDEGKAFG
jgi:voltage-gated potassium channel